ncbi:hypothetical protein Bca52824_059676 [Brassica carinata]|uniref:ADP-ribosyl cyclase/cyclic ADP-ribose hydrolase n=1 Tax=Brassica carinata TaxID=52824 RepID=A0A8X7QW01_BRACI|nr:hypothetical protein Bca52824_059676 [Brassica carinata]
MASSSRSWRYNVFPSFHGPDVRVTFMSHLKKQFQHNGIIAFNDEGIERSKLIGTELIRSIRESRISIVVLSENYGSSSWCLNELLEILKCQESAGQIVMTVFYKVDPCDVRKQMGEFGKTFKETCEGKTETQVHKWIHALTHVANIAGEHSVNWNNEAKMIEKISLNVSDNLNATPSRDFDGMVGLEGHLGKIQCLLILENDEPMTLGISGPAGIGKTTIARALYNQLSPDFPLRYFMENVGGSYRNIGCGDHGSKLRLQEQLLLHILNQTNINVCHLDVISERLCNQKVLIVLDDVDSLDQLDALAKDIYHFGSGSRIIVTTKDQELLERYGITNTYHVGFPSNGEALEIFCRYAFRRNSPKYGFEKLAIRVAELCGNLPLGLRVVGSSLGGKSGDEWEVIIHRLETSLDEDLERVLRVGYETLHEKDQALFLHIAIFFNNKDQDYVKSMLHDCNLNVEHGLRNLVNRSLIDISTNGEIVMHSLLQQMARQVIQRQEPWKRHILIDPHEICDVLEYETGTRTVCGIYFDTSETGEVFVSKGALKRMRNLQFLTVHKRKHCEKDIVCIPQDLEFPPRLKLLHWEVYPRKSLPMRFHLENLVELNMRDSQLEKLWEGSQPLTNLKKMDLAMSCHLKELPDLSNATNLERLNLNDCESLVEIPSSFSNLHKLKALSMFACTKLEVIPAYMNLASLESVDMTACQRLRNFPDISRNVSKFSISVEELDQVPESIRLWSRLRVLTITSKGKLKSLTHLPQSVKHLHLSCIGEQRIPYFKKSLQRVELYLNSCRSSLLREDCEPKEGLTCPYDTPYTQLDYTNCFKLDREAQTAIITEHFAQGWACLPGGEVPVEFDHRAKGNRVTIHPMSNMSLTIFKVCVLISPNQQTRESEQLVCSRISKGMEEISVYAIPRIQRKHLFLFPSYLLQESTSREAVFTFSSELEIVECGVQIWKDESERNQSAYSKPGNGEEEDVSNNQQDTYNISKAWDEEEAEENVNLNPAKRTKR